jgi:hypothetical protein
MRSEAFQASSRDCGRNDNGCARLFRNGPASDLAAALVCACADHRDRPATTREPRLRTRNCSVVLRRNEFMETSRLRYRSDLAADHCLVSNSGGRFRSRCFVRAQLSSSRFACSRCDRAPGLVDHLRSAPGPTEQFRPIADDEITVDGYVMKPEMRGTSRDPRAVKAEQWLIKVRMVDKARIIQVHADQAQWQKLRENHRVKVTYRVGKYTGTVWAPRLSDSRAYLKLLILIPSPTAANSRLRSARRIAALRCCCQARAMGKALGLRRLPDRQ